MTIQFHETGYGRRFFDGQLPALIKALEKIGEKLERKKAEETLEADTDYVLPEGVKHTWITVGKHSVCVKKTDEGVVVDIYVHGKEDEAAIGSTYAFDHEVEDGPERESD